ncbi:MAG: hypothetical protein N3A01_04335 [Bacteroidales bacterium]|nr:hypothetical protein [Bacteroidales bacterium]
MEYNFLKQIEFFYFNVKEISSTIELEKYYFNKFDESEVTECEKII